MTASPRTPRASQRPWRAAIAPALSIAAPMLALIARWFATRDRHIVFLYHHDMGALYPDTSSFSAVTASRYWMAGLVAAAVGGALYLMLMGVLGRLRPPASGGSKKPDGRRVAALAGALLVVGVPAITMTVNAPTLPALHAARVTLAALCGLAIAVWAGDLAYERPVDWLWLAADGLGLSCLLLMLISVERLGRWSARGATMYVVMMAIMVGVGLVWLGVVTAAGWFLRRRASRLRDLLLAGLGVSYLAMPLLHHTVGTDGYFYISDSANFFADHAWVQGVVWLVVAGFAWGLMGFRQRVGVRGGGGLDTALPDAAGQAAQSDAKGGKETI